MDDTQKACLGFSLSNGVGPMTFIKLISQFKTPALAFFAPASQLQPFFRTRSFFEKFISFRNHYDPEMEIKKLEEQHVWVMTQYDGDYPKQLKNISDPPVVLYGKGDRNSINFLSDTCIGIVGTRKPTPYGIHVAEELGKACAMSGMVIVSGMATGIDTLSHKAAILEEGRTIAVQGTGIDMIYPPENKALHEQILKHYGIVISEYPPGFGIGRGLFVVRNRIIVGLSKAVIVIEGGEHSGSLITARYAAENGRDVYAVPGPITSDMSVGPHILLREGAHILTSPKELLRDFGIQNEMQIVSKKPTDLVGHEKSIYDLLSAKKYYIDELGKKAALPIADILPILSLLEVRGVVGKSIDGRFTVLV